MTRNHPAPGRIQTHSLMPLLVHPHHLVRAARGCMRTASSPGADGVTWHEYRVGFHDRLARLAARLRDGSWRPGPVRQITWPSADKHLAVTIPTVEDRIVHRAIRRCAEPILEAHAYPEWMFGWRPDQGRIHALAHAQKRGITSPCWVADVDIARATAGGTLTNLRLLPIDHTLSNAAVVRVTDNYVIFCAERHDAHRAFDHLSEVLSAHGLTPSPTKSKVWRPNLEDLFLAG